MERELAQLLHPHFEQGPRALEQVLQVAPALEHWFVEREPVRQRWRCPQYSLDLDYCPEQCCW
jgi:hypothetical protein